MVQNKIYFPKPTGPYPVGTLSFHLIDNSRKNEFAEDSFSPHRELMIQVWYPAQGKIDKASSSVYAPDAIKFWKEKIRDASIADNQQLSSLDQIFVYANTSMPLAQKNVPFPVLIFCPGFGQMRTNNTALCENVASWGYIVVSIDHTYISEKVIFPDGRTVSAITLNLDTIEKEQHLQDIFVDDVAFVLNQLKQLNSNSSTILHNGLDLDHMGIFGHSIGGSTALFATKRLNKIKAGINLDGGILGNKDLLHDFNKPFMHIIAEESVKWAEMLKNLPDDQLINYGFKDRATLEKILEKSMFLSNTLHVNQVSDVYRVVIHGAGHMSFCDAIFLKDNALLEPLLYLRFGIGKLSGEKVTNLATACIITFFNKYLKSKSDSNIKKIVAGYPEIEIL